MNERIEQFEKSQHAKAFDGVLGHAAAQADLLLEDAIPSMSAKEIEGLRKENEDLRHDITGVLNRKALRIALNERIQHPIEEASLAVIDLKSLKWVNDTFTHKKGDVLLQKVAHLLKNIFPQREDSPIIGRIGGDEFAYFLPDATDEEKKLLEECISFLFDDSEQEDDGCWIAISDTVEVRLRGRFDIEHIDNGRLTMEGLADAYEKADEKLTAAAEIEKDRGKPSPIRSIQPR